MRWLLSLVLVLLAVGTLRVVGCGDEADLCEDVLCEDDNDCTTDACNPLDGLCVFAALPDEAVCTADGEGGAMPDGRVRQLV